MFIFYLSYNHFINIIYIFVSLFNETVERFRNINSICDYSNIWIIAYNRNLKFTSENKKNCYSITNYQLPK